MINILVFDISRGNGTEKAVCNIANNFSGHGYYVNIISILSKNDDTPFFKLNKEVNINHLGISLNNNLFLNLLTYLSVICKLFFRVVGNNGDLYIGSSHSSNFILSCLSVFNRKNKYIGCEHMSYYSIPIYSRIVRRFLYRFLDAIVLSTNSDYSHYSKKFNNSFMIYNELSFYPDEKATLTSKSMLAIGRFEFQKGYFHLLSIVKEVFKKHPDWKLEIYGEGSLKHQIKEYIESNQLQNNIVLNDPIKDIEKAYLKASIYLLTSEYEGFGLVLTNALSCGVPIVAWNCPYGPSEILSENDSFLTSFKNNEEFVERVNELIENEELRFKYGENARKNAKRFFSENIFRKWEELFKQINFI
jgi:glycosyltransferase involved in cell wall biosynthesis